MKRAGLVGLVWFVAAGAHAQVQGPPDNPPARRSGSPAASGLLVPAAPAAPAAGALGATPCSLMAKDGVTQTPLPAFDTAITTVPLPTVPATANAAVVLCNRATIVPEVADYRVLTEMHLPLAIKAGQRTLFLGATAGHFQVGVQDGDVTPDEKTALQDRMDQMQTAMEKASAKK